jgi:nucleoside-diphosphate-sugar epimerase
VVDIEDVVQAVILALECADSAGRAFNLSHPEAPTWNELLTRYAIALGAVPVQRISKRRLSLEATYLAPPLKVAEILARACKLDITHLPTSIPPSLVRVMGQEIRLDSRRVEADLGLRWRDLNVTLEEATRWCLGALGRSAQC